MREVLQILNDEFRLSMALSGRSDARGLAAQTETAEITTFTVSFLSVTNDLTQVAET